MRGVLAAAVRLGLGLMQMSGAALGLLLLAKDQNLTSRVIVAFVVTTGITLLSRVLFGARRAGVASREAQIVREGDRRRSSVLSVRSWPSRTPGHRAAAVETRRPTP